MHILPDKWMRHIHLPSGHSVHLWMEHLFEDEHFWIAVAWIIVILTFAFFATAPAY